MSNLMYKQGMTHQQLAMVESEFSSKQKSPIVAWLLWLFAATLGGHRFYLGNTGYAICMILFGWVTLFIWPLVDGFFINRRIRQINDEIELNIITRVKSIA